MAEIEKAVSATPVASDRLIKIPNQNSFLERGADLPPFIWKQAPFKFEPQDFVPSSERLGFKDKGKERIFNASLQRTSLARFRANPSDPCVYVVASEPNDSIAMYFAAYLVNIFLTETPDPFARTVMWERMYGGFKTNKEDALNATPSLLVLSNLTPDSTAPKLEKARDLLVAHEGIPRIVVVSGEDPVSFCATRLYYKMTHLFFHSANIVRRRIEVL